VPIKFIAALRTAGLEALTAFFTLSIMGLGWTLRKEKIVV
jgi:hypothetical protein